MSETEVWRPADAAETAAMLAEAHAKGLKVAIQGGGSKGPAAPADRILDMTTLSGVERYEPGELVLRALAGTPVAEIEALLADQGQMLAFEPPDFGPLFGAAPRRGTLGGLVAAGLSGPRRIAAGAVRDHLLGFEAVNGKGEAFKAGGPVVKNVTGYDLPKLVTGSWGGLCALTSVTLKVLPKPRAALSLRIAKLTPQRACEAMSLAMGGPWSVSGAAHHPGGETLLRLEGFSASVQARAASLRSALKDFGRAELVAEAEERWRDIRDLGRLAADGPLWRVSVPPADGWRVVEAMGGVALMDWAGGLVWAATDSPAAEVAAAARAAGGHARALRGGGAQPAADPLLETLAARVKTAFDPAGVLAGRL